MFQKKKYNNKQNTVLFVNKKITKNMWNECEKRTVDVKHTQYTNEHVVVVVRSAYDNQQKFKEINTVYSLFMSDK